MLMANPKSISFLPIFFKLGHHPQIMNPVQYNTYRKMIVEFLFTNIYQPGDVPFPGLFGAGFLTADLSEKSLVILQRLVKEKIFFQDRDYRHISMMFWHAFRIWLGASPSLSPLSQLNEENTMKFIESRLRLLVELYPPLLERSSYKVVGKHSGPMLGLYSYWNKGKWVSENQWSIVLVIAELGMKYYPEKLGFFFHKEVYQNLPFQERLELQNHFCNLLEQKISDETTNAAPLLDSFLGLFQHNPKALLPDSLYFLLRQNPLGVLKNDRSNEQQRMREAYAKCIEENERLRHQMESTEEENNSLRDLMESAERENKRLRKEIRHQHAQQFGSTSDS